MLKQSKTSLTRRTHLLAYAMFAASALYLAAPVAYAADDALASSSGSELKSFVELDTNHDGFIDIKESKASPALIKSFDSADTDKDGRLTVDEYAKTFSMK